jgi:hypothetical protein
MNADGSAVRQLTHLPGTRSVDYATPKWSRDGRMITFRMVTPHALEETYYNGPPTPRAIVYRVNAVGRPRPQRASQGGAFAYPFTPDQQNLSYDAYQKQAPYQCKARSPDGKKIAFYRQYDDGRGAGGFGLSSGVICIVDTDGGNERELTQKALSDPQAKGSNLPSCPKPNYPY